MNVISYKKDVIPVWNGKQKAVTFSFDDGVTQDERAIDILNRYDLKATFNINSSLLGLPGTLERNGTPVSHNKVNVSDLSRVYEGHELAVHTLTHPNLTGLDEATILHQVESDRKQIEALTGQRVVGMAYPCGGVNNDDRVADIIRRGTPIRYARTITSTHKFDRQENLLRFDPTVYYVEDCVFDIVEEFLTLTPEKPQLLYIWGHTYELDYSSMSWERFETLCARLSGHDDIFYGTNAQVLL